MYNAYVKVVAVEAPILLIHQSSDVGKKNRFDRSSVTGILIPKVPKIRSAILSPTYNTSIICSQRSIYFVRASLDVGQFSSECLLLLQLTAKMTELKNR